MKLLKINLHDAGEVSVFTLKNEIDKKFGNFVTHVFRSAEKGYVFSVTSSDKDSGRLALFRQFMIEKRGVKDFPLGLTIIQSKPHRVKPFSEKILQLEKKLEDRYAILISQEYSGLSAAEKEDLLHNPTKRIHAKLKKNLTKRQKNKILENKEEIKKLETEIKEYKALNVFPRVTSSDIDAVNDLIAEVNEFIETLISVRGITEEDVTVNNLAHNKYRFLMIANGGFNTVWDEAPKDAIFIAANGTQVLYSRYDQKAFDRAEKMGKKDRFFILEKLLHWKKPRLAPRDKNIFVMKDVMPEISLGRADMLVAKLYDLPNNTGLEFEFEDIFEAETKSEVGIFHRDGNVTNNDFTNLVILPTEDVRFLNGKGRIWIRLEKMKDKGNITNEIFELMSKIEGIEQEFGIDVNERNSKCSRIIIEYVKKYRIDLNNEELNREIYAHQTPEEKEESEREKENNLLRLERDAKAYGFNSVEEFQDAELVAERLMKQLGIESKTGFYTRIYPEMLKKTKDYNISIYELASYENRLKRLMSNTPAKIRFEREMKEKNYDDPLSFFIDRDKRVLLDEDDSVFSKFKKHYSSMKQTPKEKEEKPNVTLIKEEENIKPQESSSEAKPGSQVTENKKQTTVQETIPAKKKATTEGQNSERRRILLEREEEYKLVEFIRENYLSLVEKNILGRRTTDLLADLNTIKDFLKNKFKSNTTFEEKLKMFSDEINAKKEKERLKINFILKKPESHHPTRIEVKQARDLIKEEHEEAEEIRKEQERLDKEERTKPRDQEKMKKEIEKLEAIKKDLEKELRPLEETLSDDLDRLKRQSVSRTIDKINEQISELYGLRKKYYDIIDEKEDYLTQEERELINDIRSKDFVTAIGLKGKKEYLDLLAEEKQLVSKQNHFLNVFSGLKEALKSQEERLPSMKLLSLNEQIKEAYGEVLDVTQKLTAVRNKLSNLGKIRDEEDIVVKEDTLEFEQAFDHKTLALIGIYEIDRKIRSLVYKRTQIMEKEKIPAETEALMKKINQLQIKIIGVTNEIEDLTYNLKDNRDKRRDLRMKRQEENAKRLSETAKQGVERLNELREKGANLKWSE